MSLLCVSRNNRNSFSGTSKSFSDQIFTKSLLSFGEFLLLLRGERKGIHENLPVSCSETSNDPLLFKTHTAKRIQFRCANMGQEFRSLSLHKAVGILCSRFLALRLLETKPSKQHAMAREFGVDLRNIDTIDVLQSPTCLSKNGRQL